MDDQSFASRVRGLEVDEAAFRRDMAQIAPAERCYVIVFSPRSGSTWLTSVLAATQRLGTPEEFINPGHVRGVAQAMHTREAADLLPMLKRLRKSPNGVFGIEVRQIDVRLFGADIFFDAFGPDTVFFHLWRENIIAQGISLYRAVASGQFHARAGETRAPHPPYDAQQIANWVGHVLSIENDNVLMLRRAGRVAHDLRYEEIVKDRGATIGTFARALGVPFAPGEFAVPGAGDLDKLGDGWNAEAEARLRREHADFVESIEAARLVRMALPSMSSRPAAPMETGLTETALTERTWRYGWRGRPAEAHALRLLPGGVIGGYDHPNERIWRLQDGVLSFLRTDGSCTVRFDDVTRRGSAFLLHGAYLRDPAARIVLCLEDASADDASAEDTSAASPAPAAAVVPTAPDVSSVPPRPEVPVLRVAPPMQTLHRASLEDLAASLPALGDGRARVEAQDFAPAVALDLPPFRFGATDLAALGAPDADAAEAKGLRVRHPGARAWLLREATVHGGFGMVSLDEQIVAETLYRVPWAQMPDGSVDGDVVRVPAGAAAGVLPAACHLLAAEQANYFHWNMDALARFVPEVFAALGSAPQAPGGAVLLVSELDRFWKWESLHLLVPDAVPRLALAPQGRVLAQRLLYVPDLSGEARNPHPQILTAFDAMAAALLGPPSARRVPWRRLYVARTDATARVLANEAEIAARAERCGFAVVVPGKLSVPEQARLFAEASHIVAPHGAGLTNIVFCQPGAALCELHMDRYLHWAYRRLAALRGLRYGCVVGRTVGTPADSPHADAWRVDPDAVEAVMRDPCFLDG